MTIMYGMTEQMLINLIKKGDLKMTTETKSSEEEDIYSCSVVISQAAILNFYGSIEKITESLQFLKNSLFFTDDEAYDSEVEGSEFKTIPVILTPQDDASGVRIFSLKNYKDNIY
ncbi:MAG: hypothetical protein ACYCT7_04225 [bacterium]